MNRRAFFGAFAAILAAPAVAMATKFDATPPMIDCSSDWLVECYETPNGETITGTHEIAGVLYVFTASSIYRLDRHLK
jgi:hypothetical protein